MDSNLEDIIRGLNVLAENQNRINQKVDSILELTGNQYQSIEDLKLNANNQNFVINNLVQQIDKINSKLSDLQIQFQNSTGDIDTISNDLQSLSMQIENIRQLLTQWKFYSEI